MLWMVLELRCRRDGLSLSVAGTFSLGDTGLLSQRASVELIGILHFGGVATLCCGPFVSVFGCLQLTTTGLHLADSACCSRITACTVRSVVQCLMGYIVQPRSLEFVLSTRSCFANSKGEQMRRSNYDNSNGYLTISNGEQVWCSGSWLPGGVLVQVWRHGQTFCGLDLSMS